MQLLLLRQLPLAPKHCALRGKLGQDYAHVSEGFLAISIATPLYMTKATSTSFNCPSRFKQRLFNMIGCFLLAADRAGIEAKQPFA